MSDKYIKMPLLINELEIAIKRNHILLNFAQLN